MTIEAVGTMATIPVQSPVKVNAVENNSSINKDVVAEQTVADRFDEVHRMAAKAVVDTSESKQETQAKEPDNETLKKAVESLNKNMANTEAVFGIHEGTNRVTIRIVDKDTKKTIKELPPEKTLDMITKVWELAGILVDERR